jgi:hypothetical protein
MGNAPSRTLPPRPSPAHPIKIVAFGTSLTARALWPDELPKALSACGIEAEVERVAKPGANSRWARDSLADVLDLAPDLVIVEFAVNDADIIDGLWPWQARKFLDEIVRGLRADASDPAILLMSGSSVRGMAQRLQRPFLAHYQSDYARLADHLDVGFLNTTVLWGAEDLAMALPDGLHPDPGREAELVVPALADAIARGFSARCNSFDQP